MPEEKIIRRDGNDERTGVPRENLPANGRE
jgi:hypothetical protein